MLDFLSSKKPKILVVGDFMVDHYIWCDCTRISPEAPVMVMKSQKEDKRLGGAGNVYANLKSLGAEVFALGLVGDDESGRFLKENLNAKLLVEKDRKTPLKSRVLSHSQQVLRLDDENDFDTKLEDEIIQEYKKIAKDYDAIVLSDYAKGVLTSKVTKALIEHANTLNLPILIDPKGSDFSKYQNATLLTPNKKEAIQALGVEKIDNLEKALKKLKDDLNLAYSIITLSEEGIALFDEKLHIIPAKALEVYDVTGAGDSVIAMLAYALALKVDIVKACELANDAAAVVVAKVGSVSVSLEEIKNLKKASFEDKIKSKEELVKLLQDQKVVFTNGCFDIMHYGHIKYLEKAKKLGDILVVGLNSDESVKRLKGNSRPINLEFQRACMLASMYFVDYVVIFDEDTPYELIEFLKPDVLVKGADYKDKEVVGSNLVKKVELIDFEDGFSTTNIINRIANDK
ncbi:MULTISPECIES: D-glycero-beta-D-manno-heptose-7-phosphate kinase [unclassified Campylobacter]|uniref:D-glycero-beta-D-manno-heptose-7-phosphate kinase n=1 Tax=unclassified Campylobacter TaxID=2593542 RepID=UPI0017F580BC|nr:D-glycero-beta-D-manno-heptose-7-phosphate kinase [Campylobacter sp. CNRCH_2014_0184h]EAH6869295.1 D-glycero-beta-D-manno-heptose-7-phosphate kinase [Campylobacter lari]MCR8683568.1 D-glycero-beta-D-manno-heptose-7-phosphate kinase [Campylobacter sp. LMG 17559]EGK7485507.1 D-glycero-beta-D-manno-heptose-7-phosphate kinase [Campylobacter lari]MCV3483285.1 D-glycero-beta-D-manno-heptose-7-phosphate kinase [Campylobacter sp. CNRCH_2014_0184h]HEC1770116.1 D-glycero-beta-D-manno-heptose-7-phosph